MNPMAVICITPLQRTGKTLLGFCDLVYDVPVLQGVHMQVSPLLGGTLSLSRLARFGALLFGFIFLRSVTLSFLEQICLLWADAKQL